MSDINDGDVVANDEDEDDVVQPLDVYGGPVEQVEDEEEVASRLLEAVVDVANSIVDDIDWDAVDAEVAGRGEDTDDFVATASVAARRYPETEGAIRSVTYPAGHHLCDYVDDEVWVDGAGRPHPRQRLEALGDS